MFRTFATLILLAGSARAHHGQDFFVNLDTRMPDLGDFVAFASAGSVEDADGSWETSLEPGFLVGTGFGTAVGLTTSWAESHDNSFGYSSVTPLLQWGSAIPGTPLRVGAALSWNLADGSRATSLHHDHGTTVDRPGDGPGHSHSHSHAVAFRAAAPFPSTTDGSFNPDAPDFNPDAPSDPSPAPGTPRESGDSHESHDHRGIHRHDEDFLAGRLILEWQIDRDTRAVANLIAVGSSRDDIDLGYSLGLRRELGARWALGLEAVGDFNTGGQHEVLAGTWFTPNHALNLRLGLGTGLGPNSPRLAIHGGVTWRF